MSRRSWPRIGCIVGLVFDFQAAEDGDAADDELFGWRVGWGMTGLIAVAAKNSDAVDHDIPGARNTNLSPPKIIVASITAWSPSISACVKSISPPPKIDVISPVWKFRELT